MLPSLGPQETALLHIREQKQKNTFSWICKLILFLCFFSIPSYALADDIFADSLPKLSIYASLEKRPINNRLAMRAYYERYNYKPFWVDEDGPRRHGRKIIKVLKNSWTHGLNPERYHLSKIAELAQADREEDMPVLELLVMDGFLNYARDLSGMRIHPSELSLRKRDWIRKQQAKPFLDLLVHYDVDDILDSVEPRGKSYYKLRKKLIRLVEEERDGSQKDFKPLVLRGHIKAGESHKRIPDIRERLNVKVRRGNPEEFYDDRLFDAVVRFQYASGLYADGIIGKRTIAALNKTRREKIDQLIVNLERFRWLPQQRPERYAVVNVPALTLWAIDDGRIEIEMPVIVGRKDRETPAFITDIKGVRLNPKWTVPPTIKKEDIWPKLQEDPDYLKNKGITLVQYTEGERQTVDPQSFDWSDMEWDDVRSFSMVQKSGKNNPLGAVRVLMPNSYNIYLHSTNRPDYFGSYDQAISSGCIRMKDPEEFANFVLKQKDGWDSNVLSQRLSTGKTQDLLIESTMPVYILYKTIWLDQNGQVIFGQDIYDRDSKLKQALKKVDGYYDPVASLEG